MGLTGPLPFLLALLITASVAWAASSTSSPASASTALPTIYPGTSSWTYLGCYNETTLANGTAGLRALSGGTEETLDTMTADTCLAFCKSNSYAYAGLEYTKECYCAPYLSSISTKLPDSSCDMACVGNGTQVCGGSLKLTVYQAKSDAKGGTERKGREAPLRSILALGVAMGVLLCLA